MASVAGPGCMTCPRGARLREKTEVFQTAMPRGWKPGERRGGMTLASLPTRDRLQGEPGEPPAIR